MIKDYNYKQIEDKWRDKWYEDNIYEGVDFSPKPKKYILAELPYPSGKFLHIGHMMRYTVPEIYSRYLRMSGYNVMFSMGWDSFGLPAETFAVKEGITPQEAISNAVKDYKKSMMSMGYAIDWKREINTSDPGFYKWTQWTFLKLWEQGLAELKEMPVWWCKELGVLADEEVLSDKDEGKISERGSYKVERKMFKQWVLKITNYAERLIADLDKVDYYDSVKQAQINWIGKKEGVLVTFNIGDEKKVDVFTTRIDTLFGVTFLALSPDHPMLSELIEESGNKKEVEDYIIKAKDLTDLEKQTKEKTGVILQNVFGVNPLNNNINNIPVFVADYILQDYGTGAVMGVPAHDVRDFEFAEKYKLDITRVVKPLSSSSIELPYTEYGILINSGEYNDLNSAKAADKILNDLKKIKRGEAHCTYKLRDQIFSRQRYWGEPIPLIYTRNGDIEGDYNLPLILPVLKDFLPTENGQSPLTKAIDWVKVTDSNGNLATRETDTMPTWAGSNWYFLRYIDPTNNICLADFDKLKYWLPVDRYFGDAGHTTVHLLYSRFWYKFLYDNNMVPTDEPYQWRMSGGLLLGSDGNKMSKSKGNVINAKDVIDNYGADAARMYLCFIGPYEDTYPWNENGIKACYRLLKNINDLSLKVNNDINDLNLIKSYNKMIKNMTEMLENLKMNTCISEIMIFVNKAKKVKYIDKEMWLGFIKVIAPFAPFLAEELWQNANSYNKWSKNNSVHLQNWPKYNKEYILEETITIPVQIDGKIRAQLKVKYNISEKDIKELVLKDPDLDIYLKGKKITKFIYVPKRIVGISLV